MLQQNSSPGGAQLRVRAASCSDTGRVRTLNEDAILMYEPVDQAVSAQSGWLYLSGVNVWKQILLRAKPGNHHE